MGYRSFLSEREKVGKKAEKAPHFLSKVHNYFPKSPRFFQLDDTRDAPNVEKSNEKQHIFRPAVCSFALSSLTLRTHVSKAPHPPSSSGTGLDHAPRPAASIGGEVPSLPRQCADLHHGRDRRSGHRHGVSRLLARSRSASGTTALPQGVGKKAAKCRHHNDQQGQDSGDKHRHCSICHFLPSPYTVPTVAQFCFFVSTPETPFLSDSPSVYHTVTERAVLRGPPHV